MFNMNNKKINLFNAINNISCLLLIILLFFVVSILELNYGDYLYNTDIGNLMSVFFSIGMWLISLAIVVCIIANIVFTIQNRKNKKLLITYILLTISETALLILRILILIEFDYIFTLSDMEELTEVQLLEFIPIITSIIIIILQIIFICHRKQTEDNIQLNKNRNILNRTLNIIILLLVVVAFIINSVFAFMYIKENNELIKYRENISDKIASNFIEESSASYFAICENYKWGYIDDTGKVVVPCIYDSVTPQFYYINAIGLRYYPVGMVSRNNEYFLISPNGETINLGKKPAKWFENEYTEPIFRIFALFSSFFYGDMSRYETDNVTPITLNLVELNRNEVLYDNGKVSIKFTYNTDDKYFDDIYDITVTKQNGEVYKYEYEYIPIYGSEIYLYSDMYIPFYNESTQGWYDLEGNKFFVNKNYGILDIKNNIAVLKDLRINKVIFLDLLTNQTKLTVNGVKICESGYIVKLENNKYVLLDFNLNVLTKEYDCIYANLEFEGYSIINNEIYSWDNQRQYWQ